MNEKWVLRVPKDNMGEAFISLFKKYLNSDSYKVTKRYTGKRPKGTSQVSTKEKNATSTRLYIESKEKSNEFDYAKLARPATHMPGSIVPISSSSKQTEEVKKESNSTIDKTRLGSRVQALEDKIKVLEELSDKHRELNGSLRVEARELFEAATIMMSILEQIDFNLVGINTCYDKVPWVKLEEVLHKYGK
tara:strand:+ start:373 stop:945 length:573 start_codon:yes stop_codon:yes gene_type:complete